LTTDQALLTAGPKAVTMLARLLRDLVASIDAYDKQIGEWMAQHPDARIFTSLPGAADAMAPRLLAAFGADRQRMDRAEEMQNFSGIAPVTKRSGKRTSVHRRWACPKFFRQTLFIVARFWRSGNGPESSCFALGLSPFAGLGQLAVARGEDFRLPAGQLVGRRQVADRAVQADLVVVFHVTAYDPQRLVQGQRRIGANTLGLDGAVVALQLPIALRIVGTRAGMRQTAEADELLEVLAHELGTVVRDDPRVFAGKLLQRPLQDDLLVLLRHRGADLPVHAGTDAKRWSRL